MLESTDSAKALAASEDSSPPARLPKLSHNANGILSQHTICQECQDTCNFTLHQRGKPPSLLVFLFLLLLLPLPHQHTPQISSNLVQEQNLFMSHTDLQVSNPLHVAGKALVRTARRRGWIRLILLVLIWDWGLGATWSKTIPPHAHTSSSQLQTSQLIIATAPHLFVLSTKHPTSHNRKHSVANTSTSLAAKVQLSLGGW